MPFKENELKFSETGHWDEWPIYSNEENFILDPKRKGEPSPSNRFYQEVMNSYKNHLGEFIYPYPNEIPFAKGDMLFNRHIDYFEKAYNGVYHKRTSYTHSVTELYICSNPKNQTKIGISIKTTNGLVSNHVKTTQEVNLLTSSLDENGLQRLHVTPKQAVKESGDLKVIDDNFRLLKDEEMRFTLLGEIFIRI